MIGNKPHKLIETLKANTLTLATAESCTAGMIASLVTSVAGASAVFDCGFITYSNQSKINLLGVAPKTLNTHGAVSMQTAEEMAFGAVEYSDANIAVSVTGIAGPDGGSDEKPVGTVFIGVTHDKKTHAKHFLFTGDRDSIRAQTCDAALDLLIHRIEETP